MCFYKVINLQNYAFSILAVTVYVLSGIFKTSLSSISLIFRFILLFEVDLFILNLPLIKSFSLEKSFTAVADADKNKILPFVSALYILPCILGIDILSFTGVITDES